MTEVIEATEPVLTDEEKKRAERVEEYRKKIEVLTKTSAEQQVKDNKKIDEEIEKERLAGLDFKEAIARRDRRLNSRLNVRMLIQALEFLQKLDSLVMIDGEEFFAGNIDFDISTNMVNIKTGVFVPILTDAQIEAIQLDEEKAEASKKESDLSKRVEGNYFTNEVKKEDNKRDITLKSEEKSFEPAKTGLMAPIFGKPV